MIEKVRYEIDYEAHSKNMPSGIASSPLYRRPIPNLGISLKASCEDCSGFDIPGSDGPGFDGPGSDGPGFDGPGSDGPGSDR
jgi:hypothetical protein